MQDPPEPEMMSPRGGPLAGRIAVPADRFFGQRALLLGALATGTTTLTNLPEDQDLQRLAAALRALGARVESRGGGAWQVAGRGIGGLVEPAEVLEIGGSATAAALLCGLLAGHPVFAVLTGDAALRARPMHRLTQPLAATGARFTSRAGGRLPLAVEGAADPLPLDARLSEPSATVKSALLLAGLCARGTTRVAEAWATQDTTESLLRHFGAEVTVTPEGAGGVIELVGQPELRAAALAVPGDAAAAAFAALAALLVPGSAITILGLGPAPLRAGLFAALREMGGDIRKDGADLHIRASVLAGIDLPVPRAAALIADLPALAVAAACARGPTRLRGLRAAAGRLAATAALLAANGIAATMEGEDFVIAGCGGPPPGGGVVEARGDPRIAMAGLVLGLAARRPVQLLPQPEDGRMIENAFPGFVALMNRLAGTEAMGAA
ncbi:3-phosphoshikimate 1-carboxyvinyltransferase [Falsiroseomonas sp.]|uniref:3-phosphoshikimate 1-carboxyvinyltransferase n=1 Tax=Falsiroseomonas sp. TaxID=2870721 RepID=UPI003F7166D6